MWGRRVGYPCRGGRCGRWGAYREDEHVWRSDAEGGPLERSLNVGGVKPGMRMKAMRLEVGAAGDPKASKEEDALLGRERGWVW